MNEHRKTLAVSMLVITLSVLASLAAVQTDATEGLGPDAAGDGSAPTEGADGTAVERVYINGSNGDDSDDGSSPENAVKTLDRAKELAGGDPIVVVGTITVGNNKTLVVDNVVLQRGEGFTGYLLQAYVKGTIEIRDSTIDGMGIAGTESLVHTQQGKVIIGEGAVLRNNGSAAVTIWNSGGVLEMTGGEIYNNTSSADGGAIEVFNAKAVITGGEIHSNTTSLSGGAVAVLAGELELGDVSIHGNTSNGVHTDSNRSAHSFLGGGGAIYVEANMQDSAEVTVDGTVFGENTTKGHGDIICIYDGHRYNDIAVTLNGISGDASVHVGGAPEYGYPEVTLAGSSSVGSVSLGFDSADTGAVLGIAEDFSDEDGVAVSFPSATPTVPFAVFSGEADAGIFTNPDHSFAVDGDGVKVSFDRVFLHPDRGDDGNDGNTRDTAVRTIAKAKELADGRPIVVLGTVTVGNYKTLAVEGVTLQRGEGFTGYLLQAYVNGTIEVRDCTIDGMGIATDRSLVHTQGGKIVLEGSEIRNSGYTAVTAVNGGGLTVRNCHFHDNSSPVDGGAVYVRNTTALIEDTRMLDNHAALSGGALASIDSAVTITDSVFEGNTSDGTHSRSPSYGSESFIGGGGAIYSEASSQSKDPSLRLDGTTVSGNTAKGYGGGICIYDSNNHHSFESVGFGTVTIMDNEAAKGTAVYAGFDDTSEDRIVIGMDGTPEIAGTVYLDDGSADSGITILAGSGFAPVSPVTIGLGDYTPAYHIVTFADGTVSPGSFELHGGKHNGMLLVADGTGMILSDKKETVSTDGEGNKTTTTVTVDEEGNIVSTETVEDENGEKVSVTTEINGEKVTTKTDGETVTTKVEGSKLDDMADIIASQMDGFENGEKMIIVDADGPVSISEETRDTLKNTGASLSVDFGDATVELDNDALGRIGDELSYNGNPVVNDVQEQIVGGSFHFDISAGTHELGGKATVTVSYTLGPGEDPEDIIIVYIGEDGETETLPATYADGKVTFETTHMSLYMVSFRAAVPDIPEEPVVPDTPSLPVIPPFIPDEDTPVIPPVIVIPEEPEEQDMTKVAACAAAAVIAAILASFIVMDYRRR